MISEYGELRLALFLGLFALMFFIEGIKPERAWREKRAQRAWFSIKLAVVNNIFMKVVVTAPFIFWTGYVESHNFGLFNQFSSPIWLQALAAIVIFDFFDYIKHRWFHRVGFMWKFHRVHHTDTHLDIFTALRYHPGEFFISSIFKAGWLMILGVSPIAFIIFEIVLNIASEYHHSNICFPKKFEHFIRNFIVTPRYHTIHRDKGDYNFSTVFTIWDRLFGSQKMPERSDIDLERLGVLQDRHLSLYQVLKSPILPDAADGSSTLSSQDLGTRSWKEIFLANRYLNQSDANQAILIDVREENEIHREGILEGALWLPLSKIQDPSRQEHLRETLQSLKGARLFLYCAKGIRSQTAEGVLNRLGANAKNMGGLFDLTQLGIKLKRLDGSRSQAGESITNYSLARAIA